MKKFRSFLLVVFLLTTSLLSACGIGAAGGNKEQASAASSSQPAEPSTVKIGLLKNVTHAPAFVAIKNGYFQKQFGNNIKVEVVGFDNGSDFSTAMATGQIDIGFVGPSPVTNQYVRSKNIKIISGSNNGGAVLVARNDSGISSVKDLVGKTAVIPTKGSTNEISLRLLLEQEGVKVTTDTSGVQLITMAPADTLVAMKQKQVDVALLPEPWGTQIVGEGIGKIVVDWNKIPPNDGDYPLTIVVANDKFLKEHRNEAKAAIRANSEAIEFIQKNPEESYKLVSDELKELTGKGLALELIKAALDHLRLTTDVDKASLETMAKVAIDAGYIKGIEKSSLDLSDMLDLSLLQEVKNGK
ncbi:aliphatic sulfonate ABC transporter substrate-binding protein [Paenibacillus sp. 5J-6]|uniref:Aliphatic sulfonate ABC transporter substrate-binding protein n=1 Tax=Paenibacillus silvestris TaxID=2606219 RepID=A0A6L8V4F4_9BACL|nr:ABC transporter substrate-binding protein [Paenibacillus silvestris]MZQ85303.1 aliphatic sulfonate ABC transporter substrate-binding protein [Paenibacillus silvestris]